MKNRTRTLWQCMLVASLAVITACGGKTQVSEAPVLEPAVQTEYRIGPGDDLQVFVWNHPELTVTVPVRPDGLISTPLVEDLPAEGKTPSQLSRDLEKALAEYVRSPTVNVIVTSFVSRSSPEREGMRMLQQEKIIPPGRADNLSF